ncbi:hypothetical protein SKAU_G00301950 [Synaphobranchus kaupii]|uniref:Uncharacterized protein n=1 Tax=Synaphobranchus kaupii TaxID=118154 RepID=A0A9Q1IME4_SYNKA|nr:hypothetical protein SKAU_G00301950 [Synaphobranchus kaupii]
MAGPRGGAEQTGHLAGASSCSRRVPTNITKPSLQPRGDATPDRHRRSGLLSVRHCGPAMKSPGGPAGGPGPALFDWSRRMGMGRGGAVNEFTQPGTRTLAAAVELDSCDTHVQVYLAWSLLGMWGEGRI